jgi:hypothetical protein
MTTILFARRTVEPVRDNNCRAIARQIGERALHKAFGFGVERGRGFI